MNRIDLIPATIIACCVLHNICLDHEENLQHAYEQEGRQFIRGEDNPEILLERDRDDRYFGVNLRDNLARNLEEIEPYIP